MPSVPFPLSSTPGVLPGEGDGRLINVYVEKDGTVVRYRRKPGLFAFATSVGVAPRGMVDVNGILYVATDSAVVKVVAGVGVYLGSLPGTDGVTFAVNNRAGGPDIIACRESGGAYLVTGGSVAPYPDADLPADVNSVSFLGGYFLFTRPNGQIWASGLNATTVSALSFATAESSPDGLLRGFVYAGTFFACGGNTIEPWRNAGTTPFPLKPVFTGSSIPIGILTTMGVAGWEDGYGKPPVFLANDGTVHELRGYQTAKVSTPAVERFLAASTPSTLDVAVYAANGRSIVALSAPGGTWEFDATDALWHERLSPGLSRSRICRSVRSNGQWIVGDIATSALHAISPSTRTELGAPIVSVIEGRLKEYPVRVSVPGVFADFAEAAGGSVQVQWSHDGGKTWSSPLSRDLTQAAKFPVRVNRLGLSSHHGIWIRLTLADDADFTFMGASIPRPDGRRTG